MYTPWSLRTRKKYDKQLQFWIRCAPGIFPVIHCLLFVRMRFACWFVCLYKLTLLSTLLNCVGQSFSLQATDCYSRFPVRSDVNQYLVSAITETGSRSWWVVTTRLESHKDQRSSYIQWPKLAFGHSKFLKGNIQLRTCTGLKHESSRACCN